MKHQWILFFLLGCVLEVHAKSYYVAKDATGSGSMTAPYGTIAQAANVVSAGDTVYIKGGTYSERSIKPKNSGSALKGMVVFCPWPGTGQVVLTKTDNTIADASTPVFNLTGMSYVWIEGITFRDMTYQKACVDLTSATQCVVTKCCFENLGNEDIAPVNDEISMVYMCNAQRCVVSNCYFNSIYGDGVVFYGQNTQNNLICHNNFIDLKGKKRSWSSGQYRYSSAVTGTESSFAGNVICFNHISGGLDGIWLDRDLSNNIVVRNYGNGGSILVFNESRCASNWIQENIAVNMTDAGYRSATYDDTGWSYNTRYINNVATKCKYGIYLHKSKHNEVRNNICYNNTDYNIVLTDSAYKYGQNTFRNDLWYTQSKSASTQFCGLSLTPYSFSKKVGESDAIYNKAPGFKSTKGTPESFLLSSTSPCAGTGDGQVDRGAYPVYPFTDMGADTTAISTSIQPSVDTLTTEVLRGEHHTITIRLAKALSDTAIVKVIPVAGDALAGQDYELEDTVVTFLPGETQKEVGIDFVGDETDFSKLLLLRLCNEDNTPYDGRTYAAYKILTEAEYEAKQNTDVYAEAELGTVGSLWQTLSDGNASYNKYVMVKSGNNSSSSAPSDAKGWVDITFNISYPGTYILWLRTICPSSNDDSFWLKMDNNSWSSWNGIPSSSAWQWNKYSTTYTLEEGTHTLRIGYREDGAKLDKILLSCTGTVPSGKGGSAQNKSPYDVNCDGNVDISDVNAVISVICGNSLSPEGERGGERGPSADVNGDKQVDVSDVNAIIAVICNS